MVDDFILGWCGSVPLSVILAILLRHGGNPPPPPPWWEVLIVNIIAGALAVGAAQAGLGRSPGLGDVGAFFFPIAIGVITAGLYGVAKMTMGATARAG